MSIEIKKGRFQGITEGGSKIDVIIERGSIRIFEVGKKPVRKAPKLEYPEGSIDSLLPLLRPALNAYKVDVDESFWVDIELRASMSTKDAVNKLRRAGVGHIDATEAILNNPDIKKELIRNNFFGDTNKKTVKSFASTLAEVVHQEYIKK